MKNEKLAKLAKKLDSKLSSIEAILVLTSLIGLFLRSSNIPLGTFILLISLSTLAIMYYIISYRLSADKEISPMKNFLDKLCLWGLSISIIGILFRLQNYPGFQSMISIGCSTLILFLIFSFIKKQETDSRLILRTIIIAAIGLSLYFTPKEKLIDLRIISSIEKTSNK
ncbi:MAG TPA: hypothetical protein PKZ43_08500 [Bacteroidales bacterium]|nr:hypothetical protein [Bacteroidales bacterium]HQH19582.1 hypothetical protein [Bacteroidales bacterium]HQI46137.1 hypothetical protein [Bacteroidales bacterium]